MDRIGIRVEPFSTYLEARRKGPINPVVVAGGDRARSDAALSGGGRLVHGAGGQVGRYFPVDQPARIFLCVPSWPGPFDIEIDCIAVT